MKPGVFKRIDSRDRNVTPFKVYKSYQFTYPGLTLGKGGSCSWTSSSSEGSIKTITVKENESIFQKMKNNEAPFEMYWSFKDTLGGTKVTWRNKGKLDFKNKVTAFFSGGINSVVSAIYEKSLENLNSTLDYEINTYSIKVNGITTLPGGFHLKQYLLLLQSRKSYLHP